MSIYFNHPSQGNSTNYYLILGLRDKAAPPISQQINKFPPKRVKNLATPSSIFIFVFSSSTGELCSQPVRGNDRPVGRMFPEHDERRFLDPEYSFDEYFQLGSRRTVGPIKNQLASRRNIRPIKNGLKRCWNTLEASLAVVTLDVIQFCLTPSQYRLHMPLCMLMID